MRVIGGKFRGRNLKSPPDIRVRPTSDRLRETLFNVIAPRIEEARFLDLCAGSGAVGIEAISRGARHATFVDQSRKMSALVASNLELCRIPAAESSVVTMEASEFLRSAVKHERETWDIVFFDPPYAENYLDVLELFAHKTVNLLSDTGLLVVEHHHKKLLPDELENIRRQRILKQGDSALSFYECIQSSVD